MSYVPAALLLLILASASIQVGQFSVLFVACWLMALRFLVTGRHFWAAFFLAIPTAIKLYPILMLAIPLSLARDIRIAVRHVSCMALSLLITCLLIPAVMYGTRAWALNVSFWQNVILSTAGQVQYMQFPRFGNQSLDAVLLRYLTHEPDFHDVFVNIPHVALDKAGVVAAANLFRVLIVAITVATVWIWRQRPSRHVDVRPAGSGDDGGALVVDAVSRCSRKPKPVTRSTPCLASSRCCSRRPTTRRRPSSRRRRWIGDCRPGGADSRGAPRAHSGDRRRCSRRAVAVDREHPGRGLSRP